MTPREIAEKYVYGKHDALTDKQEVEDMITDIENYAKTVGNSDIISGVISDQIDTEWLMIQHPELNVREAADLREFCFKHTIRLKGCYGDGRNIFPKWKESLKQN